MKSTATVEINKPIGEVYDFTIKHVPEWSTIVVEDEPLEGGDDSVGSTFRCVTEERGKKMEFHGTVTESDPPKKHRSTLVGDMFDIDVTYLFEETSTGTKVTQNSDVAPKGFSKIIFFLVGWMMKKSGCTAAQNELLNLKKILEEKSPSHS